jgi:hypothetical protein
VNAPDACCQRATNASAASGGVFSAEAAAVAPAVHRGSLAALLTGHVLQDGEIVLLVCKPSLWFIVLVSLRWAAVIAILLVAAKMYDEKLPSQNAVYIEAGMFVLAARIMWAVLQWMGRLYVLTDLRILRLDGVFGVEIFDCPLRKVARTRIVFTSRERLTRLGTIEIIPSAEEIPVAQWQMIARPRPVHDQIVAAINRAKQGGAPG